MKKRMYFVFTILLLVLFSPMVKADCKMTCLYECDTTNGNTNKNIVLIYEKMSGPDVLARAQKVLVDGRNLIYKEDLSQAIATNTTISQGSCYCPDKLLVTSDSIKKGTTDDSNCTYKEKYSVPGEAGDGTDASGGNATYEKVLCGDTTIPYLLPKVLSTVINILKIATPIIIILFGSFDLVKAVMAQKDDEIKKGQQTFIKRLIIGAAVFLVFAVVQLLFNIVAPNNNENANMWSCMNCFVNGDCDSVKIN